MVGNLVPTASGLTIHQCTLVVKSSSPWLRISGHQCLFLCIFDHFLALLPGEAPLVPLHGLPVGNPNPNPKGPGIFPGLPGVGTGWVSPWSPMATLDIPHPSRVDLGPGGAWRHFLGPSFESSEPQVHHLPAWRPWTDYSTLSGASVTPSVKEGITIAPASPGRGEDEMRWSVIRALSTDLRRGSAP